MNAKFPIPKPPPAAPPSRVIPWVVVMLCAPPLEINAERPLPLAPPRRSRELASMVWLPPACNEAGPLGANTCRLPLALTDMAPTDDTTLLTCTLPPFRASAPLAATLCASVKPVMPVSATLPPDKLPGVVKVPPLLSVRLAEPVLMFMAGRVNAPPATTLTTRLVPAARAVSVKAFVSTTLMAPPAPALAVSDKELKLFPATSRVMSPLPLAVMLLAPLAVMAAVWVMAPPAVRVRLPAVVASTIKASTSIRATDWLGAETASVPKLFAPLVSATAPPALTVVKPGTDSSVPCVCVRAPPVVSDRLAAVVLPRVRPLASTSDTDCPAAEMATLPWKSLPACVKATVPPALTVVAPLTKAAAVWASPASVTMVRLPGNPYPPTLPTAPAPPVAPLAPVGDGWYREYPEKLSSPSSLKPLLFVS